MEFLRDDGVIEKLSEKLCELQYTESTLLPKLQEQLKQKETEIENIVNAVQKGYATEILLKRLAELEKEQNEINDAIAKEQLKAPIFTQDHFRMALNNFRKIDISTQDGKRKIIDTFINSIYLYDDHIKIVYNANGKEETVSLEELESSTLFSSGAPENGVKSSDFAPFSCLWGKIGERKSPLFAVFKAFFTTFNPKMLIFVNFSQIITDFVNFRE